MANGAERSLFQIASSNLVFSGANLSMSAWVKNTLSPSSILKYAL